MFSEYQCNEIVGMPGVFLVFFLALEAALYGYSCATPNQHGPLI